MTERTLAKPERSHHVLEPRYAYHKPSCKKHGKSEGEIVDEPCPLFQTGISCCTTCHSAPGVTQTDVAP